MVYTMCKILNKHRVVHGDMKIVFIGGGTIAKAIYKGMPEEHDFVVIEKYLDDPFWVGKAELQPAGTVVEGDIYIIAVKPISFEKAVEQYAGHPGVFVSVMASITTDQLRNELENDDIVRCMPNLSVTIGEGFIPYCYNSDLARDTFVKVFQPLGHLESTEEEYLDALTALTGTSPLYISVFIDALLDAGIKVGLPRDMVRRAAVQCTIGGAKYLESQGIHPMELKDMVSSPAGTSIHALHNLEKSGVKAAIIEAVEVAYQRAKELKKLKEI